MAVIFVQGASDPALGDGGNGGTIGRNKAGMMVQPQGDKR
jgi:hypothetical protein